MNLKQKLNKILRLVVPLSLCAMMLIIAAAPVFAAEVETGVIKAGAYRCVEVSTPITFSGEYYLPVAGNGSVSDANCYELNSYFESIGRSDFIVPRHYDVVVTYDKWVFTCLPEYYILSIYAESVVSDPRDNVLESCTSFFNLKEVINSSQGINKNPLCKPFIVLEDTEVPYEFYSWFTRNAVALNSVEGGENMTDVITAITSVWTAVATWFIETLQTIPDLFYTAEKGLTFIGTLAIFGGGLAVIILLINIIRGWIKQR